MQDLPDKGAGGKCPKKSATSLKKHQAGVSATEKDCVQRQRQAHLPNLKTQKQSWAQVVCPPWVTPSVRHQEGHNLRGKMGKSPMRMQGAQPSLLALQTPGANHPQSFFHEMRMMKKVVHIC